MRLHDSTASSLSQPEKLDSEVTHIHPYGCGRILREDSRGAGLRRWMGRRRSFAHVEIDLMRPFMLLIKPASADCNLRCDYCFYLEKCHLFSETKRHRMTDAILQRLIRGYLLTDQPVYSFAWQGGEPTLMGLDFFRRVTELQMRHGRDGSSVSNGLQTNATLIDDEMAVHFAQYSFLLGCSLDGPGEIHDKYRRSINDKPSHADVMRGIEALQRNNADFNILVLVSQSNVRRARTVYRYLTDLGFLHHQYIPCVEFDEQGKRQPFAITGREWGEFLCELFDIWSPSDTRVVSIRNFDTIMSKLVNQEATVCTMGCDCRQYFVIEHNGDIYPCDFFVQSDLKLGNVLDTSWEKAQASPVYRDFGVMKSQWNRACEICPHLDLCQGDCIKHRNYMGNEPTNISWLCEGLKTFFQHTRPRFDELAEIIRQERNPWSILDTGG